MRTWIVLGDSIQSSVADGTSRDFDLHLVQQERNVLFRNLSTPGGAMSSFNDTFTTDTIDRICGLLSYCDGVIIQAGVNDFSLPITTWQGVSDAMTRVFVWARAHGKKVLLLDLIWATNVEAVSQNHMGLTFTQYRMNRAHMCMEYRDVCTFAPRPPPFDVLSPTLYSAEEQRRGNHAHPNVEGHRIMADWIEDAAARAGLF